MPQLNVAFWNVQNLFEPGVVDRGPQTQAELDEKLDVLADVIGGFFDNGGPDVMRRSFVKYPVEVIAIVLLPDHLHTLWSLPTGVAETSPRWSWIKSQFTSYWPAADGIEQSRPGAYARSFPQR